MNHSLLKGMKSYTQEKGIRNCVLFCFESLLYLERCGYDPFNRHFPCHFAGLIVAPTAIINATPLDCQICNEAVGNCKLANGTDFGSWGEKWPNQPDPGLSAWEVNRKVSMA